MNMGVVCRVMVENKFVLNSVGNVRLSKLEPRVSMAEKINHVEVKL
jgi:hypothetical protein